MYTHVLPLRFVQGFPCILPSFHWFRPQILQPKQVKTLTMDSRLQLADVGSAYCSVYRFIFTVYKLYIKIKLNIYIYRCVFVKSSGKSCGKSFLLCMFGGWAGFGGKGLKFESFTFRFFSNKSLPQLQRLESVSFASFWQLCL